MKFAPYTSASDALMRERLMALALNAPPETANSTLIAAPAGYGKTTLLSQIQQAMEVRHKKTAWLNCSAEDRQPDIFLANLGHCFHAAGLFDSKSEFGVTDLMAALSAKGSAALLIDEYENASSEGSDNILETIIRTLPASCHLFIATRELPKISLTKLLVDGRTRFVDARELRFSATETSSIIAGSGLPASYAGLIEQSEGWPVMVQLARLDWQSSGGQPATASPGPGHRLRIFDYLAEQILTKMAPEIRNFLLEISVLSEVDIPSAKAVTEVPEAEKMLRGLLRLRPIITIISEQPFALRLHPLFRDFLRHDSINFPVTDAKRLHQRAALHFAAQKELSKAIDHAAGSGSADLIVQLLEEAGGALLNVSEGYGRVRSYLAALSPNLVTSRPRLHLMRIMQQAMEGTSADWISEFERFLEQFDKAGIKSNDPTGDFALQTDLVRFISELSECKRVCVEAPWPRIDDLRQKCLARKFEEPRYFGIELTVELAFIVDYGSLQLAEQRVEELKYLFETANFAPNFSWVSLHLTNINWAGANLAMAEQHARICLDRVMDSGETRNTFMRQNCNAVLGQCYFEQNNLDLALAHFETIPKKQTYIQIMTFVFSVCTEARCRFLLGDRTRALADIEEAYQFALDEGLPHFILIGAATVAEFRLLTGDVEGCRELIVSADLEKVLERSQLWFSRPWLETEALVRLFSLYWTHTAETERAYDLAHEFAVRARQSGRRLMAAHAEILVMEAAFRQKRQNLAHSALDRALEDTSGSSAVRPFLDMSAEGFALLEKMTKEKGQNHTDWIEVILGARGGKSDQPPRTSDNISPREKEVLIGLSHGHPTKIIARELDLSHETVRHHLKKIYAKLRVHTREQAVKEALRRNIITP
jgi:LuxR family maltose regulon positive regulatory protein